MKLNTINEAYDKNLAEKVAKKHDTTTTHIRNLVTEIDPELTHGIWILKQLHDNLRLTTIRRLHKAITKFKKVQDQLPLKDINQYKTLDTLEQTLENIQEPEQTIHPIQDPGMHHIKDYQTENITYHAYAIYNPQTLAKHSRDAAWCVKDPTTAARYLDKNPQIIIYKNNNPTTLFALDQSEIKNSGNIDETRPQILDIINDITTNHTKEIQETAQNHKTTIQQLQELINKDPQQAQPDKLPPEIKEELLRDPTDTLENYIKPLSFHTPITPWPELERILASLAEYREEEDWQGPAIGQALIYYTRQAQPDNPNLITYLKDTYNYDPPTGLKAMLNYTHGRKSYIQALQNHTPTNIAPDPQIQQLTTQAIKDHLLKDTDTDQMTYEQYRQHTTLIRSAIQHSQDYQPIPELIQKTIQEGMKSTEKHNYTMSLAMAITTARELTDTTLTINIYSDQTTTIDIQNQYEHKQVLIQTDVDIYENTNITDKITGETRELYTSSQEFRDYDSIIEEAQEYLDTLPQETIEAHTKKEGQRQKITLIAKPKKGGATQILGFA